MRRFPILALALGATTLAACMSDGATREGVAAPTAPAAAAPTFESRMVRDGSVLIAPQPLAADLEALGAKGVRRVINLRTPEEMATLGFDAESVAKAQGMDYTLLPIAGNAGFTPASLDAFSAAMATGEGDVLLHCASGTRAAHLYAAWLVREKGLGPEDAMRRVGPLGLWPLPMERLLDRPLRLEFTEATGG